MSEPFDRALLERQPKLPCTAEDMAQALAAQHVINEQIYDANFVFNTNNLGLSDIRAFPEELQRPNDTVFLVGAPVMWAVVKEVVHAPAADNGWLGVIRAWPCRDMEGNHPQPGHILIFIRARSGETYTISQDDIVGYERDVNGDPVVKAYPTAVGGGSTTIIISDGSADQTVTLVRGRFWCKAQHNWSTAGTVSVKFAPSKGGTAYGAAFDAEFRMATGAGRRHDPNVVIDQYILCELDTDGTTVIVTDPDAYDDVIGTVKGTTRDPIAGSYIRETTGSGWAWMDGTGNAAAPGSGLDTTDRFLFSKVGTRPTLGDVSTGDRIDPESHDHGGVEVTVDSATTGVTVAAHPDHTHLMGCTCSANNVPNDGTTFYGWVNFADQHSTGPTYTGTQVADTASGGGHASPHPSLTLDHSPSDPGHTHTASGTMDADHSDCGKARIWWIERIDNSTEATSI